MALERLDHTGRKTSLIMYRLTLKGRKRMNDYRPVTTSWELIQTHTHTCTAIFKPGGGGRGCHLWRHRLTRRSVWKINGLAWPIYHSSSTSHQRINLTGKSNKTNIIIVIFLHNSVFKLARLSKSAVVVYHLKAPLPPSKQGSIVLGWREQSA